MQSSNYTILGLKVIETKLENEIININDIIDNSQIQIDRELLTAAIDEINSAILNIKDVINIRLNRRGI